MSELDPELEAELQRAPVAPTVQTSRLALLAAGSAVLCLPGVSGVLGVGLGLLALRQINSSSTIQGANLALFGILAGLLNLLGWGALGMHVLKVREAVTAPTESFMRGWVDSEEHGEREAAPGLRPLMRHGEGDIGRRALAERLGPFVALGARSDFDYRLDLNGEHVTAAFPLRFQSGAPCSGEFEYAKSGGRLMVVGYRLDSPVLRDLVLNHQNELHGEFAPDLQAYDPDSASDSLPASRLKSYRH